MQVGDKVVWGELVAAEVMAVYRECVQIKVIRHLGIDMDAKLKNMSPGTLWWVVASSLTQTGSS